MFDAFTFRQVVDSLPQCIFWKDRAGLFLGCNLAGAQALGLADVEDIVGKSDFDFHADREIAEYLYREDEAVMRHGTPIYHELSQAGESPETAHWYETSKIPLHPCDCAVMGILISYEDVTERQLATEALKESNEHLDVAANYTYNWAWWVDQTGRLRWISPSVADLCGYTAGECFTMADYPFPIIHPDDREKLRRYFLVDGGDKREIEFRIACKDGKTLWGSLSDRHVFDRHGAPLGVRFSVRDITKKKWAEAALSKLNKSLEQRIATATEASIQQERLMLHQSRHAAMGEMIGNIAHQWRQPLTTLGLLLQNIRYDCQEKTIAPADLAKRTTQAMQLIERMSSTIDDFRNFFRTDANAIPIRVDDSIEKALVLMDASLKHARITVTTRCTATRLALGRPNELGQALLNLITNAKDALRKYRDEDRRIWCEVADAGERVIVTIGNNGGGIPADQMEKIFDPYYTTKADGTGLGLYIARRIIEQHFHGSITCNNIEDEDGVEFVVTLPASAASLTPSRKAGAAVRGRQPTLVSSV